MCLDILFAPSNPLARRNRRMAMAVLALVALALISWGTLRVYLEHEGMHRHHTERNLQNISHLQLQSLKTWRDQHLSDAALLAEDTLFSQAVVQWLQTADASHRIPLQARLRMFVEQKNYTDARFVDAQGNVRLTPQGPAQGQLPPEEQEALQTALAQAIPGIVEPHLNPSTYAFPFVSIMAPLFDGAQPIGAIWLVVDVRNSLYPLLERWTSNSATAESMIVTADGDSVLLLSPARHLPDSALTLRIPLSQTESPSVQAVLGARGIYYGKDYRGHPVMAMAMPVDGAPWYLVTKIDLAEAFASEWMEMLAVGSPIFLGLLAMGGMSVYWQRRAWQRERALKQELQRNLQWLESAQKAADLGYFSYEQEGQKFAMSPMACRIFGLPVSTSTAALERWLQCVHPDDRKSVWTSHQHSFLNQTPLRAQYRVRYSPDAPQESWVQVWGEWDSPNPPTGRRITGTVQDITERKASELELANVQAALQTQLRLDPMTQVANRRALEEDVQTAWQHAHAQGSALSLLMLDVDHFKTYNDYYGHVAGDQCLQQVAQAVSKAVQVPGSLVARYGGEEFAVLLPNTPSEQALQVAESIREAVSALQIEHVHSAVDVCVTISIGVSSLHTAQGLNPAQPQDLFMQADEALYRAKQSGRNRAMVHNASAETLSIAI